jgi:hypothetical protein
MKSKNIFNRIKNFTLFALAITLIVFSCDTLEKDFLEENVEMENGTIFLYSEGSGIFTLSNIVRSTEPVIIGISSFPVNGQMQDLGNGLFQYTPEKAGSSTRDGFKVRVSSKSGQFIKEDSVGIVVGSDPTKLECGVYASNDNFIYTPGSGEVELDVLANDYICSSINRDDLILELPCVSTSEAPCPPYWGSARVSGLKIKFSSTIQGEGVEKFMYAVRSKTNNNIISIGYTYINVGGACEVKAFGGTHALNADSTNAITINPVAQDWICNPSGGVVTMRIVKQPLFGTLDIHSGNFIKYTRSTSINQNYDDAIVYEVCAGGLCDMAQVKFRVNFNNCTYKAVDDVFYLIPSQKFNGLHLIDVISNDCSGAMATSMSITRQPAHGQASLDVGHISVIKYTPGTASFAEDEIEYEVCFDNNTCSKGKVRLINL